MKRASFDTQKVVENITSVTTDISHTQLYQHLCNRHGKCRYQNFFGKIVVVPNIMIISEIQHFQICFLRRFVESAVTFQDT